MIFDYAPTWQHILLTTPTAEEGGPSPLYTFDAKLHDLQTVLCSLRCVGWAWPALGDGIVELERGVAEVERRRSAWGSGEGELLGGDVELGAGQELGDWQGMRTLDLPLLSLEDIEAIMAFDEGAFVGVEDSAFFQVS